MNQYLVRGTELAVTSFFSIFSTFLWCGYKKFFIIKKISKTWHLNLEEFPQVIKKNTNSLFF